MKKAFVFLITNMAKWFGANSGRAILPMKYWAFLSYSHRDKKWGDWLHKALENYRVPRRLVGKESRDGEVPRRVYPVFRDREELPVSADLGSNIEEALRESRYLIVICSPHSAQSRWVGEEIKTFKRLGREDRILALIIGGEPNASDGKPGFTPEQECFPEALRYRWSEDGQLSQIRSEPIAADAREGKDGRHDAKLKLLAGLLGINYDDLKQREQRRKVRRRFAVTVATVLLVALIGGVWAWQEIKRLQLVVENQRALAIRTSTAYFNEAIRNIGNGNLVDALAYLGSSMRSNPQNRSAVFRLVSLLGENELWTAVGKPMRHRDIIFDMRFGADGKRLVTASRDYTAQIWDAETGEPLSPSLRHESFVKSALFTLEGKKVLTYSGTSSNLITGSLDYLGPWTDDAHVWDSENGKSLGHAGGESNKDVASGVFSRDGKLLITLAIITKSVEKRQEKRDGLRCINVETGAVIFEKELDSRMFPVAQDQSGGAFDSTTGKHIPSISTVLHLEPDKLSADGSRLLICTAPSRFDQSKSLLDKRGYLALWDVETGRQLWGPTEIQNLVDASISAEGNQIIVRLSNGHIELRDAATGRVEQSFATQTAPLAARLTPSGEMLVAIEVGVGDEDRVQAWRRQGDDWEEHWKSGHAAPRDPDSHPRDILFSPDGLMFVAFPSNTIFDTENGLELARPCDRDRYELMCAEFSPDGKRLATGSYYGVARIWNVTRRSPLPTKTISTEPVIDFELSQNGNRLTLFTEAGGIVILDSQSFSPTFKFPPKENYRVSEHALSPDGKRLAVIFDVEDEHGRGHAAVVVTDKPGEEAIIEPLIAEISSAEPTNEEGFGDEAIANLFSWNADSSKLAVTTSKVVSVCFFPDGDMRLYGQQGPDFFHASQFSAAGTHLYIFDKKGVLVWDLSGQIDPVRLIDSENGKGVLSPDGKNIALATPGEGGSLSFWNAQTGKRIGQPAITWTGVKSEITSLAYSADSARLVATTWQGGFRIFDPASGRPITDKIDTQRLFSGAFVGKDRLLLTTGKLEVELWNSDGKRLAGAIHTSGSHPEASITSDGKNLLFANDDGQLVMQAMPGQFSDAPEWLPDLAEAVCGWRVNDAGILESIEDTQPEKLQQMFDRIRASPEGSPLKDWAMTTIMPLAGAYEPSKNSSYQQQALSPDPKPQ